MKSTTNYMSPTDFKIILDTIPSLGIRKWSDEDIQMLFKILYWAGLRFSEGCDLLYENIDLERHEIVLGKTKTEKYGIAVIGSPFLDELTNWLADKEPGKLFPGLTYDTAIRWIYRMGKLLDVPAWKIPQKVTGEKTKSHIFRKTIGKDMMFGTHGKKASLNIIAKQLRHTDMRTTEKYLNVTDDAVRDYWDNASDSKSI